MEVQLRRIRNETEDDIRTLERSILRCQENITRLKGSGQKLNPKVLIERNQAEIEKFNEELLGLRRKLGEIESGQYEEKLRLELEQNKKAIQNKTAATKKKKAESKVITTTEPKKKSFTNSSNHRFSGSRDFDYAERQYFRDCASVPDHLREKLKNMPNNMGYIWKDIWCFGDKPTERNMGEITLYEKRNQQFLMHVYNSKNRMYYLYDKDNTGKKKLLEKRSF